MDILVTSVQGDAKKLLSDIGHGCAPTNTNNVYSTIVESTEELFHIGTQLGFTLTISGGVDDSLVTINN